MSTLIPPVELSSERILLRPYRIEDAGVVLVAATESVETVGRWMPWCHAGYAETESVTWIEKTQAMWQSGEAYEFALFDRASRFVGGAGINQFNRLYNFATLGYWVRQSQQRHGLATAAVRLLTRLRLRDAWVNEDRNCCRERERPKPSGRGEGRRAIRVLGAQSPYHPRRATRRGGSLNGAEC